MCGVTFGILLIAMYIVGIVRYMFGIDIDEYGNLQECTKCNAYKYRRRKDLHLTELEYCQNKLNSEYNHDGTRKTDIDDVEVRR